ncbi:MAG: leucine-rich repeat domain-containing protein [Myxococcales bacterium]|nr:leucine-rich repeat domain-containing protein [Myxococcales bacterium]
MLVIDFADPTVISFDPRPLRDVAPSPYPFGYETALEELTLPMLINSTAITRVSDPAGDHTAHEHAERVYSVRIDKSEAKELRRFPNLRAVEYTEKKSAVLPAEVAALGALRCLELEGVNRFKKLPKALAKLPQLEAFGLTNAHNVREIGLLRELTELRYLSLYNTIKLEDYSPIGALAKLEELRLDALVYSLRTIPRELAELPALRRLSLASTVADITDLSVFEALPQLEVLNLEWRCGAAVPPALAHLRRLTALDLSACEAEDFSVLSSMGALELLAWRHGERAALPAELGALSGLRHLRLQFHKRLRDDADFSWLAELRGLETLAIEHCGLTRLPRELGALERLRELSVNGCSALTDLSAIRELPRLEYLSVEGTAALDQTVALARALPSLRFLAYPRGDFGALADHPTLELVHYGSWVEDADLDARARVAFEHHRSLGAGWRRGRA